MQRKKIIIENTSEIIEYLDGKSESIIKLIKDNNNCTYTLFQKYISHSDIISSGKRTGKEQSVDKNYLYYLSNEKMEKMQQVQKMESAKQSNIGMPYEFFQKLDIPLLKRRKGHQESQHSHPLINDYAAVFLVNDTLNYFNIDYTKLVFEKLNKNVNWDFQKYKINFSGEFTKIKLSYAIHGLGIESDEIFHKLRRNIFKTDSFMCLIKVNNFTHEKELYILLEKNPIFFTIIGESNSTWQNYLELKNIKDLQKASMSENVSSNVVEKTRKLQNKWKEMLAAEMMNYTSVENQVFCPITYITADYNNLKTLYRASHIKSFSECNVEEAFDINNGLLLCANADALFDKHLITINEKKELVVSFLLEHDGQLKQMLRLNNEIFESILNEKRMEYLKYHNQEFLKKEKLRKSQEEL